MTKLEERVGLFRMETAHQEAPRVPLLSNFWSWKIADSKYKLSEALFNMDILRETMYSFQEKYNFDAHYETNWRNPLFLSRSMGSESYTIDDERNGLSYVDQCFMAREDYDALIENPEKFFWSRYISTKYENASLENIQNTLGQFMQYLQFFGEVPAVLAQKYEVPPLAENALFHTMENLGCGMRGLKNLSLDIRRCPDKVEAAMNALDEYFMNVKKLYASQPGKSQTSIYDLSIVFLAHTLMSAKNFERFYIPFIKSIADYCESYDKTAFFFLEGDNTRLWDYFKDLPKDRFLLLMETDNIYDAKKYMGDVVALAGGIPSALLSTGTPAECVAEAKKAVDILGAGGGYVVSTEKMMSFRNDCRAENLKAVNDFLTGYYKA